MTDNIILFSGETTDDIPADRVLHGALGQLGTVLLIGEDTDGHLYLAASTSHGGDLFMLLERCKADLVRRMEEGE